MNSIGRGSLTDRKGVSFVESFFINEFDWAFREQSILDYGVDAIVEQRQNNIPTGKLIALQIKSGESYTKNNAKGNIDYYIKSIHLNYWLNYQLPVIILLYNPKEKNIYWKQIAKRNLIPTTEGNYKISISNLDIMTNKSLLEMETIVDNYSYNNKFDIDIESMSIEEINDYVMDLLDYCTDSINNININFENYSKSTALWLENHKVLYSDIKLGIINSEDEKQNYIRVMARKQKLAVDVFTQRLCNNEKNIFFDTYTSTFCFFNKILCSNNDLTIVINAISEELMNQIKKIEVVISQLEQFYRGCENVRDDYGREFVKSNKRCSIAIQDYMAELKFLKELISNQIQKIKANKHK